MYIRSSRRRLQICLKTEIIGVQNIIFKSKLLFLGQLEHFIHIFHFIGYFVFAKSHFIDRVFARRPHRRMVGRLHLGRNGNGRETIPTRLQHRRPTPSNHKSFRHAERTILAWRENFTRTQSQ